MILLVVFLWRLVFILWFISMWMVVLLLVVWVWMCMGFGICVFWICCVNERWGD